MDIENKMALELFAESCGGLMRNGEMCFDDDSLDEFRKRSAAQERESCAKVCKDLADKARVANQYVRADHYSVCESHIRERSNA